MIGNKSYKNRKYDIIVVIREIITTFGKVRKIKIRQIRKVG